MCKRLKKAMFLYVCIGLRFKAKQSSCCCVCVCVFALARRHTVCVYKHTKLYIFSFTKKNLKNPLLGAKNLFLFFF